MCGHLDFSDLVICCCCCSCLSFAFIVYIAPVYVFENGCELVTSQLHVVNHISIYPRQILQHSFGIQAPCLVMNENFTADFHEESNNWKRVLIYGCNE